MPLRRPQARPLYTGLRVRNLGRSVRFYRALGFRELVRMRTRLGVFVQLEHPRTKFTVELNQFRRGSRVYEPYRKGSEMDHFGFWVDEVDTWVKRLCRAGGKVRVPPFDSSIIIPPRPWFKGRAAYVADPDGIWVELMGPVKGRPRKPRGIRTRRHGRSPPSI